MNDESTSHQSERNGRLERLDRAIARCGAMARPAPVRAPRTVPEYAARDAAGRDDAALVAAAVRGDEHAFQELFTRHRHVVRMAVADRVRDPERQQELVQDAFSRAFARLATLRDPTRFRPWLLQVARRIAIDDVRRAARQQIVCAPLENDAVVASDSEHPARAYELRQLTEAIEQGLGSLSERDRRVLSMSARWGLGIDDIAANVGVSPATAKVVLHRARRRLMATLGDVEETGS